MSLAGVPSSSGGSGYKPGALGGGSAKPHQKPPPMHPRSPLHSSQPDSGSQLVIEQIEQFPQAIMSRDEAFKAEVRETAATRFPDNPEQQQEFIHVLTNVIPTDSTIQGFVEIKHLPDEHQGALKTVMGETTFRRTDHLTFKDEGQFNTIFDTLCTKISEVESNSKKLNTFLLQKEPSYFKPPIKMAVRNKFLSPLIQSYNDINQANPLVLQLLTPYCTTSEPPVSLLSTKSEAAQKIDASLATTQESLQSIVALLKS